MVRPSTVMVPGAAGLAPSGAGRASRAARVGSRGRPGARAAGATNCSRNSNWRARLMAAAGGQRLRILDPDVDAEWRLESADEELYPLRLLEWSRARKQGLEPVLVLGNRTGAPTRR
jgi:hypothetical protein